VDSHCECRYLCGVYCKVVLHNKKDEIPVNCLFNKLVLKLVVLKVYKLNEAGLLNDFIKNFTLFHKKIRGGLYNETHVEKY